MGEIKKLGLRPPSRSTIKRILKEHDLDPGPRTDPYSWQEFLKRHVETLYECDFFSKRIWTQTMDAEKLRIMLISSGPKPCEDRGK